MTLRDAIQEVQTIGLEYGFTIIVVGGAVVRLIGNKTTIKKIDAEKRIVFLDKAENPGVKRGEDTKTTVDIDAIAFSNSNDPFTQDIRNDFYRLKKALLLLQKNNSAFPAISLEAVLYHPYFQRPNQLTQFVSSVESYHDRDFFFRLGSVKQDVSKKSLSFWTYTCDNGQTITSFMPPAIQRRYAIRGFSIKPKDKEKVWGDTSAFSQFVKEFNKKTKNAYEKEFLEWDEFALSVASSQQPSMRLKKALWKTYWTTIGTYLAHGTGLVGKLLLPLGNTLFAGK